MFQERYGTVKDTCYAWPGSQEEDVDNRLVVNIYIETPSKLAG